MSKPRQKSQYSNGFKGFIQCDLTDKQKAALKASAFTLEDGDSAIAKLNEQGYKFGLSYDSYNSCYQCSMNCGIEDSVNNGWCLTGRGSSPMKALKQVLYKHFQVFREDWTHGMGVSREEIDD